MFQFYNLKYSYPQAAANIIDGASGQLLTGDKVGLIGPNGAGKSTLLNILAGTLPEATGEIASAGQNVLLVRQNGLLLNSEALSANDIEGSIYEYLASIVDDWWEVSDSWEKFSGKQLELDAPLSSLSGGQRLMLSLLLAIAYKPLVLMLDEPSNHLDEPSRQMLTDKLLATKIPLIISSHDIDFLNAVTNSTWELFEGKLNIYGGNYEFYEEQVAQICTQAQGKLELRKKQTIKTHQAMELKQKNFNRHQQKLNLLGKMDDRSMPKFMRNSLKRSGQQVFGREMVNLRNKLEGIDSQQLTSYEQYLLDSQKRLSRKIAWPTALVGKAKRQLLSIREGSLHSPAGKLLQQNLNLQLATGDKLRLAGANGTGKSCLARFIAGEPGYSSLVNGQITCAVYASAIVSQDYLDSPANSSVEELIRSNSKLAETEYRKVLAALGFQSDDLTRSALQLSGGQIARLQLAVAICSLPDVLLLDEPTNNLDIYTKQLLARALGSYPATMVIITHDDWLVRQLGERIRTVQLE
jgi:ATPase subunit of ABC transporter with duplicated ATPase domains